MSLNSSSSLQNQQQHQFHSALRQIQQWVQTLISLASDVRFIAVSSNNSVVLCSDILKVIDEVVLSSRTSMNSKSHTSSELDQKVEDQAKISVIERTFSLISKWISSSSENTKNGLNVQLHFALSLLLMNQNSIANNHSSTSSSNLSSSSIFSRMKNIMKRTFHRTRGELQACDSIRRLFGISSSSNNLRLILSKLCHHYHDGELTQEIEQQQQLQQRQNVVFSPSQAFLLSISNHASFLVVEALAQQIEKCVTFSEEKEPSSPTSLTIILDQIKNKMNSNLSSPPKIMSIPYSSNPAAEPNVLGGFLVSYLFSPNQILVSGGATKKKNEFWETNQDSFSVAWRMNENFEGDCGVVVFGRSQLMNSPISYFDASCHDKNNNNSNRDEIFLTLISEVDFASSFRENAEEMILQFANYLWHSMMNSTSSRQNEMDHSYGDSSFVFAISSSTCHVSLEFLASVAKKIEKRITDVVHESESAARISSVVFSRVASQKNFEKMALVLDFIPEIMMIKPSHFRASSSPSKIEFVKKKSKSFLRFYYSGVLPDSLIIISRNSKNSLDDRDNGKGLLMQLCINDDDGESNENENGGKSLNSMTITLHRRTISQLSALQSFVRRIWDHLISCLQPSATLIRGGGFVDCMWLKNLVVSKNNNYEEQNDENNEDNDGDDDMLRRNLENAIRFYLCALVKTAEEKVKVEERINNFIAKCASNNEDDDDDDADAKFPGLFSEEEGDSSFPIDVLQKREENLLKALDFAEFVSSITAVERSWNVDFRQSPSDGGTVGVVVNRTLEFH